MENEEAGYPCQKLTLQEWLSVLSHPKEWDDLFIFWSFPTTQHRVEYVSTISQRSEHDVIDLIEHFLISSGSLGIDDGRIEYIAWCRQNKPDIYEAIKKNRYYRRLFSWTLSKGEAPPPWEGITWILDLLPHWPDEALTALNAYFLAHAQILPDGRINGIGDATELIRAKFIGLPVSQQDSLSLLLSLRPRHFECLVERLYKAMSYKTALTPAKSDGGRDVIIVNEEPGRAERTIIECKRYAKPVGVEKLRAFLGTVHSERVNKGLFIATSGFTRGAIKFVRDNPQLEILNGNHLIPLLNRFLGTHWPLRIERLVASSLRENSS